MHDEDDFLRKLLESPADDTVRLVYADWLDERGDEEGKLKSQFLRLTVQLHERRRGSTWRTALRTEMQPLAAKLPTDWLAVVSRLRIDQCGEKMADIPDDDFPYRQFELVCSKEWDDLTATGDANVRFCESCEQNVHYCDTIVEARRHARLGHCVAVDLGIIRRDNDLAPRRRLMGRMLPNAVAAARRHEREVDEVSREREERKRQQNAGESDTSE